MLKKTLKKIWFPVVVVLAAAMQTFGMDVARTGGFSLFSPSESSLTDTVIYDNSRVFTKFRKAGEKIASSDSLGADDTLSVDDTMPVLTARDTIHAPDSLRETDPFRYRYYVALVDSLTHKQVRDSLIAAGDSLDWPRIDSIYFADSARRAKEAFEAWYNGLDKAARKQYDYKQKMKRKMRQMDSTIAIKDSLKAIKDSIAENTPRILETYAIPEDYWYRRIFAWHRDQDFSEPAPYQPDTSYNYWFNDYPFMRQDVNVSYLGVAGSAVQPYDFFKRTSENGVSFYTPYEVYSYSPATLPMYNTKTPYTELAYWGTLFANESNEEADIKVMTTQNIFPSLNLTLGYERTGSHGMILREKTENRTAYAYANYLGKKYLAHGGFIYNRVTKNENGGVQDPFWIRDTTVDAFSISVNLANAANQYKKRTFFLDQTFRIPFTFIKDMKYRKEERIDRKRRDSVAATGDSIAIASMDSLLKVRADERALARAAADTLDTDVTTAFIGHNSEFSTFTKTYTDKTDGALSNFYDGRFLINPTQSMDSLRVMKLDNKVFIKLQPWSSDAIVSSLNVGIGDRLLNYYLFQPDGYLTGSKNTIWNTFYLYAGVGGQYKQFFNWNAKGHFDFAGAEAGDFGIEADASFQFFPFRRHRKSPIRLGAHFETTLDEPEFYTQHFFSNHFRWENDFQKISTTKIDASLEIPHWQLGFRAGYALLANNIYFGTDAMPHQNQDAMSVLRIAATKNFTVWKFHLDNQALVQISSKPDVLPLPTAALNLKWYFQFDIVKNVMQMQIGANALYTTWWNAPAYNPVSGTFYNQTDRKYGDCPYIDAFINIQWKRACIFFKLVNANMGWPMDSADYFSADGYIRSQRAFKIGLWWPFYLQPGKQNTMSSRAGSSGGGGGGGGSMLSGLKGGLSGLGGM